MFNIPFVDVAIESSVEEFEVVTKESATGAQSESDLEKPDEDLGVSPPVLVCHRVVHKLEMGVRLVRER